jgi:hypothetical protein
MWFAYDFNCVVLYYTHGGLQVGQHKVSFIKPIAEGGFGTVSLVKDTSAGASGGYYALKLLLCQTKEQVRPGKSVVLCACMQQCIHTFCI